MLEAVAKRVPAGGWPGIFMIPMGRRWPISSPLWKCVAVFDSSVSGLGGCPYARHWQRGEEDVLFMLDGMGIETGSAWTS
jgi:hydroxymethylglutaryl-CoA lyase